MRYFLLLARCGTHQAGLSAKNGVIGRVANHAAVTGAETAKDGLKGVTATAVRLFKYLIPEYYENMKESVKEWVGANSEVLPAGGAGQPQAAAGQPQAAVGQPQAAGLQAARLQALYTKHVIPDELLKYWHGPATGGRAQLRTVAKEGENIAAAKVNLEKDCVAFILKDLLAVDTHPTITRFFTFRGAVNRMLTMALLGFPQDGLSIKKTAAEISTKRMKRVKIFFGRPAAAQALRRASLVLQLTAGVEAFMSAQPQAGDPPTVVALQQGKAHEVLESRLQHLLKVLHYDPDLNVAAATGALVGTAADLTARLNAYLLCPYKFVRLCRRWFPSTYCGSVTSFLQEPSCKLDVAFSAPLQSLALAQDGESSQRGLLLSDSVQEFLEEAALSLLANSLPAERKAAEVKRHEARNISLIGNVSRELLCRSFTRQREAQAAALNAAAAALRKAQRKSWQAYAWEWHNAAPIGLRCTGRILHKSLLPPPSQPLCMPATGGPSEPSEPATGGTSEPSEPATGGLIKRRSDLLKARPRPVRSRAVPEVRDGLATGGVPITAAVRAQCTAERQKRIDDAQFHLDRLNDLRETMPCTRLQWAAWISDNLSELQTRMSGGGAQKRRAELHTRVRPRPDLPRAVTRFQPQADNKYAVTPWGKLLEWRTGWYGLQTASVNIMLYVLRHPEATYVVDIEQHRVEGGRHPYHLSPEFSISDCLSPLSDYEKIFDSEEVVAVHEYEVEFEACPEGGVVLRPTRRLELTTPAKRFERRKGVQATGSEEEDEPAPEEEEEEDSCEDSGEDRESDIFSDCPVVDTDAASDEGSDVSSCSGVSTEDEPATGGGSWRATHGDSTVARPATGGRSWRGPVIFDNGFFRIRDHEQFVFISIHRRWLAPPPHGLGRVPTMSKTVTPATVGCSEDRTKVYLLLRAWMLWRVRSVAGWLEVSDARKRIFAEEAEELVQGLRHIQPQSDGLMGHRVASASLREFTPDIAARVCKT